MRGLLLWICLGICLSGTSVSCLAGFGMTNHAGMSRFEQRQLYREAIDLIQADRSKSRLRTIKDQLVSYPLYPYIEYTEMIYSMHRQPPEAIETFINAYPNSPLVNQLLENWLYVQAKQGRWRRFVNHYRDDLDGEINACFHAYALYKEGRKEDAWAAARDLWLVEFSQPDECDPIFDAWRHANQLDREAAWQRFAMSLKSNEASLSSYLMRYVHEDDEALAKNLKLAHQQPNYIRQAHRFPEDDAKTRDAIVHGLKRLAQRNPAAAFHTFETYLSTHSFNEPEQLNTWSYIGIRLALDGDPDGLLDRVPVDLHDAPELVEARIRLALRKLAWGQVLVLMNLLPGEEQESPRWQFWKARVLAGSSNPADVALSEEILRNLSGLRNFYGFMAADALGARYEFEDEPVAVAEEEVLELEQHLGLQRALELFTLGERWRARREWYFATREFTDHQLQVAARVAQKWGWYRQAIRAMIYAEAWNDLDIRFPLAYYDSFVSNARTWDIPLHWSFAVARQESAFMPDARSSAGAMGIMQLMPGTARLTASAHGLAYDSESQLHNPLLNIRLGSAYLGRMLRRFNNNRVLASAAYNAGPARVETWLDPSLPLDVWVETIPYPETRNYVQNVLTFSTIYARQLSQNHPLIYAHEFQDFSTQQVTLNPAPADAITPQVPPDNS